MNAPGQFAPRAGRAPMAGMIAAQAMVEAKLVVFNGEQLLLALVIPTLLLVFFTKLPILPLGHQAPVDYLMPGIMALAIMSTAFTGQAITTGFERRYGVLKRLRGTPLPAAGLVAAKTAAIVAVEALQLALLAAVGLALGWHPQGDAWQAAGVLALGTVAFASLGLLLGGTLRAEATLAVSNLIFIVLLFTGGELVPLGQFPQPLRIWLEATPISALTTGLRHSFAASPLPWTQLAVLAAWSALAMGAASVSFRWE